MGTPKECSAVFIKTVFFFISHRGEYNVKFFSIPKEKQPSKSMDLFQMKSKEDSLLDGITEINHSLTRSQSIGVYKPRGRIKKEKFS